MSNFDCGIYRIQNTINGKSYIGSASHLSTRIGRHKCELNKGTHFNKHLQGAYGLYGKDAFRFEVLIRCDRHMLLWYEQRFIDILKPEYNKRQRAESNYGLKLSEEHKMAVSRAQKGKKKPPQSPETIAKRTAKLRGRKMKPLSEERKQYLRKLRIGKRQPPESIEKTASKLRGRKHDKPFREETKQKLSKLVLGVNKHTDEAKEKIGSYWRGRKRSEKQIESMGVQKINDDVVIKMHELHNEGSLTARQVMSELKLEISYAQACLILNGKSHKNAYRLYIDSREERERLVQEGRVWAVSLYNGAAEMYEKALGLKGKE